MKAVSVAVLLASFAAVACTSAGADEELGASSDEIIAGEQAASPGFDAVVALFKVKTLPDGTTRRTVFCTGSLIAPDLVLTANHCVATESLAPAEVHIAFGADGATSPRTVDVASFDYRKLAELGEDVMTAGQDAVVLRLASPVTDVTPLAVGALRRSDQGKAVTVMGYGFSDGPRTKLGVRLMGTSKVVALKDSYEVEVGARGVDARICQGDSGGPLLLERDGKLVVTGVLSRGALQAEGGALECGNPATYVRLTARTCANGARPGVTTCDGDVWKRCDPGAADGEDGAQTDCAAISPARRCDPTVVRGFACKSR